METCAYQAGRAHNIDANESNQDTLSRNIIHRDGDTDNRNDELAKAHADSSNEKELAATKALDTPDTRKGHEHVDDVGRNSDKEAVFDARILEERCAIVENEVDCQIEQVSVSSTDRKSVV